MSIDPERVFAQVEEDRASGELSAKITTATIVYYVSDHPGIIVQKNRETGVQVRGTWRDGTFIPHVNDT
ncbi:MAG: hypothetical protein ABW072_10385 [Sedimenticola sp.]